MNLFYKQEMYKIISKNHTKKYKWKLSNITKTYFKNDWIIVLCVSLQKKCVKNYTLHSFLHTFVKYILKNYTPVKYNYNLELTRIRINSI
jgi:hypothetical protein